MALQIELVGVEAAPEIHRLTQLAFAPHADLDPPSGAVRENEDVVRVDLGAGGGALGFVDERAVACLRWFVDGADFHVRRIAVDPAHHRQGIATALISWAEDQASESGSAGITLGVRIALASNRTLFESLGFEIVAHHAHDGYDHPTWLTMRKALAS